MDGKQVSRKLADDKDQYRTKRSVRPLADEVLDPLNQGLQANGPMALQQYAETVYFPNIKPKRKPSTYKGYFNLYSKQIQPRIGGLSLSTCTTADIQRILYRIDEVEELSHQSFLNINSVLSAIFTHARRSGTLLGPNPTDGVEIPEGKRTGKGPKVFPLDLATVGSKHIKSKHQGSGVDWHGFHAFRRGLGTRLFNNGVPTKTIATILRHRSGSEVTEENYIDVDESTAVAALKSLPKKSAKPR